MAIFLLDGDPGPPPPKGHSPQFSAHICCGQMVLWIKMPLGRKLGRDPSDIVFDEDPAPLPRKGGRTPQFRPMSVVLKQLDWLRIKMPRGMEVGLDPSDIVLDGDPATPPQKWDWAPQKQKKFGPCLLWPNGWICLLYTSPSPRD